MSILSHHEEHQHQWVEFEKEDILFLLQIPVALITLAVLFFLR